MTKTKQCSKCKETKELTEFYKNQYRCKQCARAYYQANKSRIDKYKRAYNAERADEQRDYFRAYRQEHKAHYAKAHLIRAEKDPSYKMICRMRCYMNKVLNGTSKHAPTLELLGCTPEHFRFHLEQQFTEGMTWDNYGDWEMDHIQPCASFDQTDPEQQKQCWHYTNYQPLWADDNNRKNDKIINEHQTKLI